MSTELALWTVQVVLLRILWLPILSGELPTLSDELPILSGELPILSGELPILSRELPTISGELCALPRPARLKQEARLKKSTQNYVKDRSCTLFNYVNSAV